MFTPILKDQPISYIFERPQIFRNKAREVGWGSPVYFVPPQYSMQQYGNYGPKGKFGYNYYNSPSKYLGNCTFWCYGRLLETTGKKLEELMKPLDWTAKEWYKNFTGSKSLNASDIQPGDILVLGDDSDGHVEFCEKVEGKKIHFSHSAYSSRDIWRNTDGQSYSCRVCTFDEDELVAGNVVNIYREYGQKYNEVVIGIIHTGIKEDTTLKQLKEENKILKDKITKIKELCEKIKELCEKIKELCD